MPRSGTLTMAEMELVVVVTVLMVTVTAPAAPPRVVMPWMGMTVACGGEE